jgi:hypothetical protein
MLGKERKGGKEGGNEVPKRYPAATPTVCWERKGEKEKRRKEERRKGGKEERRKEGKKRMNAEGGETK